MWKRYGLLDMCRECIIVTKLDKHVLSYTSTIPIRLRVIHRKHFEGIVDDKLIDIVIAHRCSTDYYIVLPVDVFLMRNISELELYIADKQRAVFEVPSSHGKEVAIYRKSVMTDLSIHHVDGTIQQYYYDFLVTHKKFWQYHTLGYLTHNQSIINHDETFTHSVHDRGSPFLIYCHDINIPSEIIINHIDTFDNEKSITCIMLTDSQCELGIECFLRQNYNNKYLCVITTSENIQEAINQYNNSRIYCIKVNNLDEYHEKLYDIVKGDYVAIWSPEDWSHPARLAYQYNQLISNESDICLLKRCAFACTQLNQYGVTNIKRYGYRRTALGTVSGVKSYLSDVYDLKYTFINESSLLYIINGYHNKKYCTNSYYNEYGETIAHLLKQEYRQHIKSDSFSLSGYLWLIIVIAFILITALIIFCLHSL